MLKNPRQELFAVAYNKSGNATAAAKAAGYKPSAAHVTGSRLLKYVAVRARVDELKALTTDKAVEKTALTESYVIDGLMNIAAICSKQRSKHFSPGGASRAYELLGKTMAMFIDRTEGHRRPSELKTIADIDRELERVDREIAELEKAKAERANGETTVH